MGVNRASLGVQDFAPHVQEAIGRPQPFEQVAKTVEWLRAAGIDKINMDLMYGLPRQKLADVRQSAHLAASLAPARLALFGYAHVPWFKTHQKVIDEATLPGVAERLAQAQAAAQTLEAEGFVAIGLDHFARPDDELAVAQREGRLHRNFQGYTTDSADALIGLGASSIGRLPQGYAQNAVDMGGYSRAVNAGRLPIVKGLALSKDDRLRAQIIERLMCDLAVDLDQFARTADAETRFADEIARLGELQTAGILKIDGHRITITPAGRPFVRLAAAAFDAYLPQNKSRHSLAV
jgi:oxygen-independent coproporphyrinogen-3 oxidase